MTPITYTQDGRTYIFSLTAVALNSVLTTDALAEAFQPNVKCEADRAALTQSMWAETLAASSPAAMSQIPVEQIRAVLAAALAGGGLSTEQPADVAERILRNQNGRDVDFLAAAIVKAAIAAA